LIQYRSFLNSDPPAIADIWRSQPPLRGLVQPMSPMVFERVVLAKPYFDRHGLIIAVDDGRPVGFAHAGFGPNEDYSNVCTDVGVTCMLLVVPRDDRAVIRSALLARSEEYLRGRGARTLYGGEVFPYSPFYLGLYGGSDMPGVLISDAETLQCYRSASYAEIERRFVMQRSVAGFRPPVDRRQMQIRRQFQVLATADLKSDNWWEACTIGQTERTWFSLQGRVAAKACGHVVTWDIEPLASGWGVRAAGIAQLQIEEPSRRQGLALFLLGEALRQLQSEGVTLAEVQIPEGDLATHSLFAKLDFSEVDQGIVLRKQCS
jgi:GNAT superfamily N-acetyltransferase